jgi:hypothetical protein
MTLKLDFFLSIRTDIISLAYTYIFDVSFAK